ncbi:response regulator transcription factor [Anaerosporobacter faecicola]|uniref:response regulator transcription factor n=1 Tax=Anaerosporobacter faecicola TaxID=2718714 RepID=UPI00143C3319|nr:response regulator [Anaerosporobacter faecicola]
MLSVMIVDDEPYIREGLKVVINWEEQGFRITGEASNGQEALELLENKKFDLVIADIRMPIYNGLELIEIAKKKNKGITKYVILSGYSDFDYVKRALNQSVSDYILKPIQKEELIQTLKKVKEDILKEQLDEKEIQQLRTNQIKNSIDGLLGGLYSDASIGLLKEYFGKFISMRYILIRMEEKKAANKKWNARAHLTELLKSKEEEKTFYITDGKKINGTTYDIGLLVYARNQKKKDTQIIEEIYSICVTDEGKTYRFYAGIQVPHLEDLMDSFKTAIKATVNQCMTDEKDQIIYFDDLKAKESTKHTVSYEKIERLTRYVKEHETEKIIPVIKDIYKELKEGLVEPNLIQLNIRYILYNLVDVSQNLLGSSEQTELLDYLNDTLLEDISYCGDMEAFIHVISDLSEYLYQLKNCPSANILSKITKEIDERYADNITLKDLGKKYYISSVYLGQIFKKEIGKSFKDYLNTVRIVKAAELLLQTNERVYAIAERVGYQKVDYFISKFVSIKGTTPHQYRLRVRNEHIPTN